MIDKKEQTHCYTYSKAVYEEVANIAFQVNLLVATSVAEEGLDIRQCNVVIRFDLAKTVLAYIQSRGRARKPGSDYILMLERYLYNIYILY